jgi:hypothetical protein
MVYQIVGVYKQQSREVDAPTGGGVNVLTVTLAISKPENVKSGKRAR